MINNKVLNLTIALWIVIVTGVYFVQFVPMLRPVLASYGLNW